MPVLSLHRVRDYLTFKNYSENRADYLAFIAQGWHLVMFGTPLFDGIIYGGQDGRLVLHTIETPTIGNAPIFAPLDKDRSELLDMIASHYQPRSDKELAGFVGAEIKVLTNLTAASSIDKLASATLLQEIPTARLKERFRAKLEAYLPAADQSLERQPNRLPDMLDSKPTSCL